MRSFLAEQRALLRELDELESAIPAVQAPVLLLADPQDNMVPVDTGRRLARELAELEVEAAHLRCSRRIFWVISDACGWLPPGQPRTS